MNRRSFIHEIQKRKLCTDKRRTAKKDVYKRNVMINGDVSVPRTLEANAINGNIFSNCKSNAKRNTAGFDFSKYEKIKENEYGIIHKMYLEKLCKIFGLKEEKYVLKEIEQKEESTDAAGFAAVEILTAFFNT